MVAVEPERAVEACSVVAVLEGVPEVLAQVRGVSSIYSLFMLVGTPFSFPSFQVSAACRAATVLIMNFPTNGNLPTNAKFFKEMCVHLPVQSLLPHPVSLVVVSVTRGQLQSKNITIVLTRETTCTKLLSQPIVITALLL